MPDKFFELLGLRCPLEPKRTLLVRFDVPAWASMVYCSLLIACQVKPDSNYAILYDAKVVKQGVLLPHELVSSMFEFGGGVFESLWCGVPNVSWKKLLADA